MYIWPKSAIVRPSKETTKTRWPSKGVVPMYSEEIHRDSAVGIARPIFV